MCKLAKYIVLCIGVSKGVHASMYTGYLYYESYHALYISSYDLSYGDYSKMKS